jgi:hypothetical protein
MRRKGKMALIGERHIRRDGKPFRLFVATDWPVTDIKNVAQAELAREVLKAAIQQIEQSLEVARNRADSNPEWFRRASAALQWKRRALREVEEIYAQLEQQRTNECSA